RIGDFADLAAAQIGCRTNLLQDDDFRFTNIEIDSLGEAFGLGNTRLMGAYGISPLQPQSRCHSGGTSLPPLIEIRPYDPCPRRRSATLFHAFIVPVLRSRCPRIYSIFSASGSGRSLFAWFEHLD